MFVLRYILGVLYAVGNLGFLVIGGLALWAKNWKMGLCSLFLCLVGIVGAYESFTMSSPFIFWLILLFFVFMAVLALLYVTEPELGIIDRFKSPESLIREGKRDKAAIKLKKQKRFIDAGRLYEEMGWLASAALCYEEAGDWEKVASLYLEMGRKEDDGDYYLRKAREILEEKLGDFKKAAEVLEELAKKEGWYWEDAAKNWEKVGDEDAARKCWEKALGYYRERVKEDDGVFLSDVAGILERLGRVDEAVDAYKQFLLYCKSMVEKEGKGWVRHVVETYYALARVTGDESFKKGGNKALEEYRTYLDEVVKSEEYKGELISEVSRWLTERVERGL